MIYVWDTNIILHALRKPNFFNELNLKYDFFNPANEVYISVVSVGEIYSIAFRNRWGALRRQQLANLLQQFQTIPIYEDGTFIVTIAPFFIQKGTY